MFLPSFLPPGVMSGFTFPAAGPWDFGSPPSRRMLSLPSSVLCSAKTANHPSRVASLAAHFPVPCLLPGFRVPIRLAAGWKLPSAPGLLVGRYTLSSGISARRLLALSSSRATPMNTCPALRPRWCSLRIAIARLELLPSVTPTASAFPPLPLWRLSCRPLYRDFEAQSRGLCSCFPWLRTTHC